MPVSHQRRDSDNGLVPHHPKGRHIVPDGCPVSCPLPAISSASPAPHRVECRAKIASARSRLRWRRERLAHGMYDACGIFGARIVNPGHKTPYLKMGRSVLVPSAGTLGAGHRSRRFPTIATRRPSHAGAFAEVLWRWRRGVGIITNTPARFVAGRGKLHRPRTVFQIVQNVSNTCAGSAAQAITNPAASRNVVGLKAPMRFQPFLIGLATIAKKRRFLPRGGQNAGPGQVSNRHRRANVTSRIPSPRDGDHITPFGHRRY